MTIVSLVKTLNTADTFSGYSGTGVITITLTNNVHEITFHTKKSLIKFNIPRTKTKQGSSAQQSKVIDIQSVTDEIMMRLTLDDDDSETAKSKYWKLRAMCAVGGSLTSLTIGNIVYNTGTIPAHLEEVTAILPSDDTGTIETTQNPVGRMEVSLKFFLGADR